MGVVVGSVLYQTVLVRMSISDDHGDAINIIAMIVCAIIIGLLGLFLTDYIEIISTSFFGSFITFRVIGLALGGYPDSK